jgi:hypothetical protein
MCKRRIDKGTADAERETWESLRFQATIGQTRLFAEPTIMSAEQRERFLLVVSTATHDSVPFGLVALFGTHPGSNRVEVGIRSTVGQGDRTGGPTTARRLVWVACSSLNALRTIIRIEGSTPTWECQWRITLILGEHDPYYDEGKYEIRILGIQLHKIRSDAERA